MLPFLKRSDRIMAVPTPHAREWGVAILSYRYSGDRRYQNGQNVLRQRTRFSDLVPYTRWQSLDRAKLQLLEWYGDPGPRI